MIVGTADEIGLTAMASLGSLASRQADQAGPGHLIEVLIESKGLVNLAGAGGCQACTVKRAPVFVGELFKDEPCFCDFLFGEADEAVSLACPNRLEHARGDILAEPTLDKRDGFEESQVCHSQCQFLTMFLDKCDRFGVVNVVRVNKRIDRTGIGNQGPHWRYSPASPPPGDIRRRRVSVRYRS